MCLYNDISRYQHDPTLLDQSSWLVVVKSQDQTIRRNRLLAGRKNGKFGRTESRPTSTGLLASVTLRDGQVHVNWQKDLPEPRHIAHLKSNLYVLTTVDSVLVIDSSGVVHDEAKDPLYAFLHSIDILDTDRNTVLVCSSGYDAIIETCLDTSQRSFLWSAWEHGFNPDDDGNWLALTPAYHSQLVDQGLPCIYVNPAEYGDQGINTMYRSAHPNVAIYNPYTSYQTIIVSIGHGGTIYEVNRVTGETRLVFDKLSDMPHGVTPYNGGWFITNTTKGEVFELSADFDILAVSSFRSMPGKQPGLENIEWIQNTKVVDDGSFLSLDANRGLIAYNHTSMTSNIFTPNPEWCLQDAIHLS